MLGNSALGEALMSEATLTFSQQMHIVVTTGLFTLGGAFVGFDANVFGEYLKGRKAIKLARLKMHDVEKKNAYREQIFPGNKNEAQTTASRRTAWIQQFLVVYESAQRSGLLTLPLLNRSSGAAINTASFSLNVCHAKGAYDILQSESPRQVSGSDL